MKYNIDELNSVIRNRRSLKPMKMSATPIADNIIQTILENGNHAPSHGHTEPWRFVIFSGDGKKKLSLFQSDLYQKKMKPDDFKQMKFDKLVQNPLGVSHIIAICMERQKSEKIPEIEEVEAVACAVQNMHLTATCFGLTALWSSGFPTYTDKVKSFLNLTEKDKCLGFFYLGYPENGEWPSLKKGPISKKVTWFK
jgi:nitroreductase